MARRSDKSRYISENTINSALRTLRYDTKEQITGHGFRAAVRTMIREYLGWESDVIERHLAHVPKLAENVLWLRERNLRLLDVQQQPETSQKWYIDMKPSSMKPLFWLGSSKKDLLALPVAVRKFFGHALDTAQRGEQHEAAKVLKGFGSAGVLEIVEDDTGGTYRTVYTVRFTEAIFVLHVFQKKSKRGIETPKPDMDIIRRRMKAAAIVAQELRHE